MSQHNSRTPRLPRRLAAIRILTLAMLAGALAVSPSVVQAGDEPVPTPASLTQALSCQSRDTLGILADRLFLQNRPPAWMRPSKLPKALDGMIGLYGFAVDGKVTVFGEPVDHVYFMKDWVVALLPRANAMRLIQAQKMVRAPITVTEQYYQFVDPEVGPMIGGFAPTGDAVATMLIAAFGGDPAPPSPDPAMLLIGCNYAVVSQSNFLEVARSAEKRMREAGVDLRRMTEQEKPHPAR